MSTELSLIRTKPEKTASSKKKFDFMVQKSIDSGKWKVELVPAQIVGLERPIEIIRGIRSGNLVKPWDAGMGGYCPEHWADIAIGEGPCGLRCPICFLILTHRCKTDPSRHVVYENTVEIIEAVKVYLQNPTRSTIGLGIDCSDSLLYEGVTGYVQKLAPIFSSPESNPHGCKLVLLTKSANVRYLKGINPTNIILTHSLNPQPIADLWEGRYPDGVRMTPSIDSRLEDSALGQSLGFETRWRIDPIFPVEGWESIYDSFFSECASKGLNPSRITLGTYRETKPSLLTFSRKWGLFIKPELDRLLGNLRSNGCIVRDGNHGHLPAELRVEIYSKIAGQIRKHWQKPPIVALCKEPPAIRKAVGLDHDSCNCGR